MLLISIAVQLQLLVVFLAIFPHFGHTTEEESKNLFHGMITPLNYNVQYQVQLKCVDGCEDYPSIGYQRFTSLKGSETGLFTFNLAPLLSKQKTATAMQTVKVGISSVLPLAGQQRVFTSNCKI